MSTPHHPPIRYGVTLLLAFAAFGLLTDVTQAQTAHQRRLVLDIELKRQGPVQHGVERGEQSLSQRWQFSALLETNGAPSTANPLDPDDQQRQLADAQRRTAAMRPAARAAVPDAQSLQAMQAQAQALQARCGQDNACLMREASAMVSGSMGQAGPTGQPRMDAPEDSGPATPYLVFNGVPACGLQLAGRIDERVKASYNDVQGVIHVSETAQGQETRRDDVWCPSLMAVLDTRNGRVWASLNLVPRDVQGVSTREESNRRSQRQEGRIGLRWWEADDWVSRRLLQLTAGGQDQARLPAGQGQAEIRMSWSFKPV